MEKYLKARLVQANHSPPKIHDLPYLLKQVTELEPLWATMSARIAALSDFAVTTRYPGCDADKETANEAFETCRRFRIMARGVLG